jgi:hypothetical protein
MWKKKNQEPAEDEVEEIDYAQKAAELEKTTKQIEAEKELKRQAREEKKFHKEQAKKRQRLERFVAPILLFLTLLASYFIYTWQHP